ncbi:MAG: family 16 glycosylhydrolase [Acidimicrobiales bacterium]
MSLNSRRLESRPSGDRRFGRRASVRVIIAMALMAVTFIASQPASVAVPIVNGTVFDDFEDNDISDWLFFGGNAAGGGGGTAEDRPAEGSYYMSTGWGGEGTDSGFYGGAFKNLDNAAQVTPPADPWFNVWVYQQSDTTVDAYTLELTLREDTDGNGWTDGAEDSIGLNTVFTSADFDDDWTLISAPLSDFVDRGTGGNGSFDGNLDEAVIVFGGVQGPAGSAIEIDFDHMAFTSGGPAAFDLVVFDDMEHGDPAANGWFNFNGAVGGGGIGPNSTDVPATGGAFSLETGWGSGGTPGFYGGFGRTQATDISGTDHFNMWINPNEGQEYTLEINLQEDDNGDGAADAADDDEFQFDCVVSATGPCATSGGGWQLLSIPLDSFVDDNSIFAGNGILDPTPAARGGNGELINVVVVVIGTGGDANFRTDDWSFSRGPLAAPETGSGEIIDDFESGLPAGTDGDGVPVGFYTFQGAGSSIALSDPATPPAPELAAVGTPNKVLQIDLDVTSFAGVIHGFENPAADTWVSQDWSTSEGISMWLHGTGSGTSLFIDILDNRNSEATTDDAERFTVAFDDDFVGWQLLEFPFASFTRKEVGNAAPNDGLGLFEMHGWAFGTLGTDGARTYYIDQVQLYGEAAPPAVAVSFSTFITRIEEGTTGEVGVKLNRPLGPEDPEQVSIDFTTEPSIAVPGQEYTPTSGTLTFLNGGPSELSFPVETFDDNKFEGLERIVVRLSNPVGIEGGGQGSILIEDNDAFDEDLIDDFENGAFLWDGTAEAQAIQVSSSDPDARPGQDAVENVMSVSAAGGGPDFQAAKMQIIADLEALLPAGNAGTTSRIQRAIDRIERSLNPAYWSGGSTLDSRLGTRVFAAERQAILELRVVARGRTPEAAAANQAIEELLAVDAGLAQIAIELAELNNADQNRIDRAKREVARAVAAEANGRSDQAVAFYSRAWGQANEALKRLGDDIQLGFGGTIGRDFAAAQDWTGTETLDFWFKGSGSGDAVTVDLKNNRAADPGPAGWDMVWSDEFNEPAGSPPNPDNWTHEIGDVTPDGKNGWGNEELQYYTDDPANAATDGDGNLVITLAEADGSLECYYGPCEYTSARLLSWQKAEFAYGRIESRLQVPQGSGIWPAFWTLGTDIDRNPWPAAGEIDIMEFVGRLPNEIFGTIHGPGYNGGGSFSGIYDFGQPVFDDYHTFTVEWEPNLITWYVDGIQYHQATPADVAPNPWVFEKPFFLLLNLAVGGNFGGPVGEDATFPQSYAIDYVRVYQGPDSAERFEAQFMDDSDEWKLVSIPVSDFARSEEQPAGAPDDGLNLDEVWGYGFDLPAASEPYLFDQVQVVPVPPPSAITVTTAADAGPGSLREAMAVIAEDGTIDFDPSLAGETIVLSSGQLVAQRNMTIDGPDAGVTVSGDDASRVFEVVAGASVAIDDLVIRDGAAAPQGGGILNRGSLSLNRVTVTDNVENSASPANFEFGGGGIYNGDGATLNLIDSTVSDNTATNQPGGGIYGFFNSTINVTSSTVSGNLSGDVAGGIRSLGITTVVNSTLSGNTSTAWHGGGIFHTDGQLTVNNSTVTGNVAPEGTASGIVVATFGAPASMTVSNSILEGNGGAFACAIEGGGAATIVSAGGNIDNDGSCPLDGTADQPNVDALLGALLDNGGPTLTHEPGAGGPAINAGLNATCEATDQRGITRPQGPSCDIGSVESELE